MFEVITNDAHQPVSSQKLRFHTVGCTQNRASLQSSFVSTSLKFRVATIFKEVSSSLSSSTSEGGGDRGETVEGRHMGDIRETEGRHNEDIWKT